MYAVCYVNDAELPEDREWVMVRTGRGMYLFLKESAVCPRVIQEAWAGYRLLEGACIPAQREVAEVLALQG